MSSEEESDFAPPSPPPRTASSEDDDALFACTVLGRWRLERALRLTLPAGDTSDPRRFLTALGQRCRGAPHCRNGIRVARHRDGNYDVSVTTLYDDRVELCCHATLNGQSGELVGPLVYGTTGEGLVVTTDARAARELFGAYWRDALTAGDAYWDIIVARQ